MQHRRALAPLDVALAALGCSSTAPRWWASAKPTPAEAAILIESTRAVDYSADTLVEVDESIATHEPFATRGRKLTQADFAEIVAIIREQALAEFVPRADRPD